MRDVIKQLLLVLLISFLFFPLNVKAKNEVNLYFFWGIGCPHCENEKETLEKLEKKYDNLKIYDFEVWRNSKNQQLLKDVGKLLNKNIHGVPFTVIGTEAFSGFNSNTTPKLFEDVIEYYSNHPYDDVVGKFLGIIKNGNDDKPNDEIPHNGNNNEEPNDNNGNNNNDNNNDENNDDEIILPIIKGIDLNKLSLPLITIVIGSIDGFNPCALWILLLLLSFLIGMNDRKKMFILGLTFIIASATVYFFFMAAWLHILLFIGFLFWIRLFIALISFAAGIYNFKSYFEKTSDGCKIIDDKKRTKIIDRIKQFINEKQLLLAIVGIILLAFLVNLIELLCSAGLPLIYTQILTLNDVSKVQYYLYLLLYLFFFMLDHIVIFSIAMVTLKLKGISTKYTKYANLIGGILMLIIGILILFKPEWLMFG